MTHASEQAPASPRTRDELVDEYLPLAKTLARRYRYSGQPLDDLIQVASIGLLKAIDRFDPDRGVGFSSFAVPTILGELKRYHRDFGWSVRVPRQLQEHALRIRDVLPELAQTLRRSPTIGELARHAGLTEEQVLEAMDAQDAYASASIDTPIDDDHWSAGTVPSEVVDYELSDEWVDFEPHLRALPQRERTIIVLRFFKDWTQRQIAAKVGISQMHVSRILAQTIKSLRESVSESAHPCGGSRTTTNICAVQAPELSRRFRDAELLESGDQARSARPG